jgi:hypothetical protein
MNWGHLASSLSFDSVTPITGPKISFIRLDLKNAQITIFVF